MPLPSQLVDLVFSKLAIRYGTAFSAQWAGVPTDCVKADWADELGGFSAPAILHGLAYLPPDRPPNAAQFARLCLGRPDPQPPVLSAPRGDPERVRAILAQTRDAMSKVKPLQWAYTLQEREKAGEALTERQRSDWREALRDRQDGAVSGWFTPIPSELWPEGMRP